MFSVLKEFEYSGMLKTNATADQVLQSSLGITLLRMNTMKTFRRVVLLISFCWTVITIGSVAYVTGRPRVQAE
jgi:hypothetical protein